MRLFTLCLAALAMAGGSLRASEISGEYIEARSCDVYTGSCFANAQMGSAGREALMAWKVDTGAWKGVELSGLSVALVLSSEGTLGYDGVFPMKAGKIKSVLLVDDKASKEQETALVDFVRANAGEVVGTTQTVRRSPMSLTNDHLAGKGVFKAGKVASIETRALKKGDCVCMNETAFYQPLSQVENTSPAYANTLQYTGDGLDSKWTLHNIRSAYLGTFEK